MVCYYVLFLRTVILWTFCSESIKLVALCLLCATLLELVLAHTLYAIQKTSQKVTCGIGDLWERDLDVSLTSLCDYLKLCESSTCRHEKWDLFGWQWFLGARTNKKKYRNAHWPHSCNLTFDKPQVSCLELPSWCVTQPHLAKAVSCDIFTISLHTTPNPTHTHTIKRSSVCLLSPKLLGLVASESSISMQLSDEGDWINRHKIGYACSAWWADECIGCSLNLRDMSLCLI